MIEQFPLRVLPASISPENEVLRDAISSELRNVLVVGMTEDGVYFNGTTTVQESIYLMEKLKSWLLKVPS